MCTVEEEPLEDDAPGEGRPEKRLPIGIEGDAVVVRAGGATEDGRIEPSVECVRAPNVDVVRAPSMDGVKAPSVAKPRAPSVAVSAAALEEDERAAEVEFIAADVDMRTTAAARQSGGGG